MHRLRLILGGKTWSNWTRVGLTADYTTPADGWSLEVRAPKPEQLAQLQDGSAVVIMADELIALSGFMDGKVVSEDKHGVTVTLTGRDLAAPLVDCSPGKRTWSKLTLKALANKWVEELGLHQVSVQAQGDALVARDHKAQPGETYWGALTRICKRLRLMPWMSPGGVLHLGRPDYDSKPVGHLVQGENVLGWSYSSNLAGRYSDVTVHGTLKTSGSSLFPTSSKGAISELAQDDVLKAQGVYRPRHMEVSSLSSRQEARDRAAWEVSKRAFDGTSLTVQLQGWGPRDGELWRPNSLVDVSFPQINLSGPLWISGVQLRQDREGASQASLTLREPHLLLPEVP